MSVTTIDALIGRRLCDARIRAGLELAQAASGLMVTPDELTAIERGEIRARASFIYEATRIYGVALSDLFQTPEADNDR